MIKKLSLLALATAVVVFIFSSFKTNKQGLLPSKNKLKKIVIDPGHGGHDGGCEGRYSNEKTVSLQISQRLGEMLKKEMPDVEVVFTRNEDFTQSVSTKANIANREKGDLFVSIHCNFSAGPKRSEITGYKTVTYYTGKGKSRQKRTKKQPIYRTYYLPGTAKGTETLIWATHKNEAKESAMRENAGIYTDSSLAKEIGDFDPNSPEQLIYYSIRTRAFFSRSANLATTIQEEFKKVGRVDREAKQRQVGIWVLQAVAMPAVLIETGFLSNPAEEDYLNSESGQNEMAACVARALKRYRFSLENQLIDAKAADTTKTK